MVIKVFILYVTKNYILFLSIDIVSNLLKNIIFIKITNKIENNIVAIGKTNNK